MPLKRFEDNMLRRNDMFSNFLKDNFFEGDLMREGSPATNIRNLKDRYELKVALPGYNKENIHVHVEDNVLHIKGEETAESEAEGEFSQREFYQSSFERSFSLPDDVDEDKISAEFTDGVLKVDVGRHDHDPKPRSRQIDVS